MLIELNDPAKQVIYVKQSIIYVCHSFKCISSEEDANQGLRREFYLGMQHDASSLGQVSNYRLLS